MVLSIFIIQALSCLLMVTRKVTLSGLIGTMQQIPMKIGDFLALFWPMAGKEVF